MSNDPLSAWPSDFKHPIELHSLFRARLRAIGGPSARLHRLVEGSTQGYGDEDTPIPNFAAWKDKLAQAIADKIEKAATDEFGPRPSDYNMDEQQAWRERIHEKKQLWYYDLGEQVKALWLKVRNKSIPTLLSLFLALSDADPALQARLERHHGNRLKDFNANDLELVVKEGNNYFTIVSSSALVEIRKLQRKVVASHSFDDLETVLSTQYRRIFIKREWELYFWDVCRYLYGYIELKGTSFEEEWLRKIKAMSTRVIAMPSVEGGRIRVAASIYDILPAPRDFVLRAIETQVDADVFRAHTSIHSLGHDKLTNRQQLIYGI